MKFITIQEPSLKKYYSKYFIKFLIVGATNTLLGYIIYLLLLSIMPYSVAYSCTFILSIGISYLLNSTYVFDVKHSFKKILKFPFIYLIQYCLGLCSLTFLISFANINQRIAPILVVLITTTITYILMKSTFKNETF